MKATHGGAVPAQTLRELIHAGFIQNAHVDHIAPASLDLSLSDEIYAISGLVLPRHNESVRDLLSYMGAVPHDLLKPLAHEQMYLARLNETLALPSEVYGYCNPKSSTGRLDMHVRVI
jgi:dCTP deaminase